MKRAFSIIALLSILASACTERIEIELDETYTRLVVYGTITTDTTRHFVELSKSTSYYYNEAPPMVSGAAVSITDSEGTRVVLTETAPGKYATPDDYYAVPGRTYTLDVQLLEEINGHSNYTASSEAKRIYPIDSIGLVYQPDWGEKGFYEVTCYYQDPTTRDFYMFNIFKNNVMLTDTLSNRFITNDDFYNGGYTNGIGVGFLDQANEREQLKTGDTITFQGCNISEDYYNFIFTLQQETGFSTPLFSGPPANVKGNISNGAAGFFAAYGVAYSTTVFTP
jgi:hypothetical protein